MGTPTANGYFYKPDLGAAGSAELAFFHASLDAADAKLAEFDAAIDPTHKHSQLWASDGSPIGVSVDVYGIAQIVRSLLIGVIGVPNADNWIHFYDAAQGTSSYEIKSSVNGRLDFFNVPLNRYILSLIGYNIAIGVNALGASAERAIGLTSGVAPTTFPADMAQMCVKDQTGGNACFHFFTELGQIIKLYQQAHIADAKVNYTTGDLDTEAEIIAAINTTNTLLNTILTRLENLGFSAIS